DGGADEREGRSVILGGSLAKLDAWCRLVPEWQKVVAEAGQSSFHGWQWRQHGDRLRRPWERLAELANEFCLAHIACVVPPHRVQDLEKWHREDHRAVERHNETEPWERQWIAFRHDPIAVCLSWCLVQLSAVTTEKVNLSFAATAKLKTREAELIRM